MKSFFEQVRYESKANEKLFARTDLIENVTEDLMIAMENLGISKAELARRLGKSKSYITQTLSGSRNMTLSSLSDLCFELNIKPEIKVLARSEKLDFTETTIAKTWHKESTIAKPSSSYEV